MNTSLIKFYNGTCLLFIADMAVNFDCFNCFYNKICTAGLCITCSSPEKECMLKTVLCNMSCLKGFRLLTWPTISLGRSNIAIRTGTHRFVIHYFTICISSTWIPYDTGINALSIFTCIVKWAVVIVFTSDGNIG